MGMPDAGQPNILVIWGDDIGIANLSCYTHGLMGYRTPCSWSNGYREACRSGPNPSSRSGSRNCSTSAPTRSRAPIRPPIESQRGKACSQRPLCLRDGGGRAARLV